jgi:hypothetical protein
MWHGQLLLRSDDGLAGRAGRIEIRAGNITEEGI